MATTIKAADKPKTPAGYIGGGTAPVPGEKQVTISPIENPWTGSGWQPTVPTPSAPGGGTPYVGAPPVRSTTPPAWMGTDQNWWTNEKNQNAIGTWASTALPIWQLEQNQRQYQSDFNEAQRRWNTEQGWSQKRDTFNMDLATRQQQSAEWQAQESANQWNKQFTHTQGQDMWGRGFSERQQKHTEGQDLWGRGFSEQQLAQNATLERERNASQELQARYAAFGRAQAPSAQFLGGWR